MKRTKPVMKMMMKQKAEMLKPWQAKYIFLTH